MKSNHRPRATKPPAEFFKILGEQAGVWLWTFHSYHRKLNVYSDLTPVIGVHPKDLKELLEHAHPDDIEIIASELEDGVVSVRGGSFKCRLRDNSGRCTHFGVTFCADKTETGVVLHGVSRDITAEVQSLAAVEYARQQSELAAAFAGIGFWHDSREMDRPEWSEGMYRIHGLDPSGPALTFEEGLDRVHPDDRHILEAHKQLGAEDESSGISFRIVRPDGEIRHIQTKSIVERDRSGAKVGRLGTSVDVTDIKRAESAVKQSEALYRFLADHAPDMITRLTPEGVIKYVSPSCERVFGYTPDEHIKLTPMDMCHPDDLPAIGEAILGLVERRQRHLETPLRYRARHKDGRWIWVETNPTLILDDEGEPFEFVDIVRDVTLTKQFEADLEEARRHAEAAASAKSAFLANMSHELRTPLTSIIGFSRLMGDQKKLDSETSHFARRISDASEALMSIINDILDFSKLEVGQVSLELQPLSLRGLIEESIGLISIQAAAKSLEIEVSIAPRL